MPLSMLEWPDIAAGGTGCRGGEGSAGVRRDGTEVQSAAAANVRRMPGFIGRRRLRADGGRRPSGRRSLQQTMEEVRPDVFIEAGTHRVRCGHSDMHQSGRARTRGMRVVYRSGRPRVHRECTEGGRKRYQPGHTGEYPRAGGRTMRLAGSRSGRRVRHLARVCRTNRAAARCCGRASSS